MRGTRSEAELLAGEDGVVGPVPIGPQTSTEPDETRTLMPYGAAKLRVTAFPQLKA